MAKQSSLSKPPEISMAVICAMPEETDALTSSRGVHSRRLKIRNQRFHLVDTPTHTGIVLITSGLGKVRAAAGTQFAIDHFNPRYLINFGSAGGVNRERNVGDIVIGDKCVEYDFQSFGGKVPFVSACPEMVKVAETLSGVVIGTIATADQNGDSLRKKSILWEQYKAECCDWEGAAIVKVASLNRVRALVFRCISDVGHNHTCSEYKKNYKQVLKISAPAFWNFVDLLLAKT